MSNSGAGIYQNYGAVLSITGAQFSQNTANSTGGAIHVMGTLTVSNSSFTYNQAQKGGGLFLAGETTLTDCTSSGNIATTTGMGSGIAKMNGGKLTLTKTSTSQTKVYAAALEKYLEDGQNWFA